MSRLPALDTDRLTDTQRLVYDSIAGGARGAVRGPFLALLNNPELASHIERLGAYVRYQCAVPQKLRELAIITVARFWRADYEWHVHAPIALDQGLSEDAIAAIGLGRVPNFSDHDQAVVYAFTRELLVDKRVSERTYNSAKALLGDNGVLDLSGLVGYYSLLATIINATEVDVPAGALIPWRA
jgi:4-carboxymuconolactone decarboxylase